MRLTEIKKICKSVAEVVILEPYKEMQIYTKKCLENKEFTDKYEITEISAIIKSSENGFSAKTGIRVICILKDE